METNLLDKMLAAYLDSRVPVTLVLQNRARVTGTVRAFDNYIILLQGRNGELIYRHAVSSIAAAAPQAAARPAQPREERPRRAAAAVERPPRPAAHPKQQRPAPRDEAHTDSGLNTGMKEGLLRWMQDQKAAK